MSELPIPEDLARDKEAMKHALNHKKVVNPLDGLPEFLKDPKNYMPVQKALLNTLSCGKLHSDPLKASECAKCSENMLERRMLMKKFGFKGPEQYMAWRKTHEGIKESMPLDMYNRMVSDRTT